jgi:hypothetical protein
VPWCGGDSIIQKLNKFIPIQNLLFLQQQLKCSRFLFGTAVWRSPLP